jgi:hypothetical protein
MPVVLQSSCVNDKLLQTLEYYHLDQDSIILQQDKDPKNTSTAACKWLDNHEIHVLE